MNDVRRLNIGAYMDIRDGWDNHDIISDYGANIVFDLNKFPYPIKDNVYDEIYVSHVLEHLDNPINVLNELHRILSDNGILIICVPHYAGNSAWADITHKRSFGYGTLIQLKNEKYCRLYYLPVFYDVKARMIFWKRGYYFWNFIIEPLANIVPVWFEHSFSNIFPPFEIRYELIKKEVS
jgi:SAM-dependent methyltransferase